MLKSKGEESDKTQLRCAQSPFPLMHGLAVGKKKKRPVQSAEPPTSEHLDSQEVTSRGLRLERFKAGVPNLWPGTGQWPVRNKASQQEVSSRLRERVSEASSVFAAAPQH